jgi:hypothetical protein
MSHDLNHRILLDLFIQRATTKHGRAEEFLAVCSADAARATSDKDAAQKRYTTAKGACDRAKLRLLEAQIARFEVWLL